MRHIGSVFFLLSATATLAQETVTIDDQIYNVVFNATIEIPPAPKCMNLVQQNEIVVENKQKYKFVDYEERINKEASSDDCKKTKFFQVDDKELLIIDEKVHFKRNGVTYITPSSSNLKAVLVTGNEITRTGFILYAETDKQARSVLLSFSIEKVNDDKSITPRYLKMFGDKVLAFSVHKKSGRIAVASGQDSFRWRLVMLEPSSIQDNIYEIFGINEPHIDVRFDQENFIKKYTHKPKLVPNMVMRMQKIVEFYMNRSERCQSVCSMMGFGSLRSKLNNLQNISMLIDDQSRDWGSNLKKKQDSVKNCKSKKTAPTVNTGNRFSSDELEFNEVPRDQGSNYKCYYRDENVSQA